jgi:DNA polymerase
MDILDIDIETYSTVDLKKSNVYAYSEDPAFEVLMAGWSLNGSPVEVWEGENDIAKIPGLFDPDVKKVAHNAGFERVCFSRMAGLPVGQYLPPEQYTCTLALAALHGFPRSLDALAKFLKTEQKDSAGTRLINLFCKPYRGKRVMPEQKPEQWEEFKQYCGQDVVTMQSIRNHPRFPGWPMDGFERQLWYVDQRINDRGMRMDLDIARAATEVAKENNAELERQFIEITGIENPNSGPQVNAWLEEAEYPLPNLQAPTIADALTMPDLPDKVEKALELRQELALVAHRKFEAVLRGVSCDGRLRGQFMYHAAHTGRWTSRGVQVHNLPRLSFEDKDPETGEKFYSDELEQNAIDHLLMLDIADPVTLKKMVRPMILLDGVTSDFSAIEARVLAWLAGEDWVTQAFVEGRDLYVETAERMGGGMGRPEGKIAVLAAGYQGSVGSFRNMGYGGRRRCPYDTAKQRRRTYPNGVEKPEITDSRYESLWANPEANTGKRRHINPEATRLSRSALSG